MISAVLIGLMRTGKLAKPSSAVEPAADAFVHRVSAPWREWTDGMRLVIGNRVLRLLTVFVLVTAIGEGIMATLFAPFVRSVCTAAARCIASSSRSRRSVVSSVASSRCRSRGGCGGPDAGAGAVLFGLVDLAIFLYPLAYVAVWPAIVGTIIVWLPGAVTMAGGSWPLLHRNTADSNRGRVSGALGPAEGVAVLLGTAGAGWLGRPSAPSRHWPCRAPARGRRPRRTRTGAPDALARLPRSGRGSGDVVVAASRVG